MILRSSSCGIRALISQISSNRALCCRNRGKALRFQKEYLFMVRIPIVTLLLLGIIRTFLNFTHPSRSFLSLVFVIILNHRHLSFLISLSSPLHHRYRVLAPKLTE